MKRVSTKESNDDLRPEYDLSQLKGGVRKYYSRALACSNVVLIEPELADIFPDTESVNRALRLLVDRAEAAAKRVRRPGNETGSGPKRSARRRPARRGTPA